MRPPVAPDCRTGTILWIVFALLSAFVTGIVAVVSKAGMKDVDSNVGMALQSVIILVITWGVIGVQGKIGDIGAIDRRSLLFLGASGVATSIAYLLYFAAIKQGDVARAAPVDRLSLVFAIIFAVIFLKEKASPQIIAGAAVMAVGAILVATAKTSP